MIGIDIAHGLSYKMETKFLPQCRKPLGLFYTQVLDTWFSVHSKPCISSDNILAEILWGNCFVLIEGRPITVGYNAWIRAGILYVQHILNPHTSCLLTQTEIENKYGFTVDVMKYNSLVSTIPRAWKVHTLNPFIPSGFGSDQYLRKIVN